jgi:hypothetical protein
MNFINGYYLEMAKFVNLKNEIYKLKMATIKIIPLLYIKPKNKSKTAVTDELVIRFENFMNKQLENKENIGDINGNKFTVGLQRLGVSSCTCGQIQSACYWLMGNGYATHSLAVHMLAYHRDEIPEEELQIIKKLME